jgi:tetratricopeptide (TPR) repeat protein
MNKPTVFISYSHEDQEWEDRLRPHLKVLEQAGRITIWDDRQIDAGAEWYGKIKQAIEQAAVAVCLVSADYLASDFCVKEEIPYLLERRTRDGMMLIPVLLRPCVWEVFPWLKAIQMLPCDGKSVSKDFKDDCDTAFAEVARNIFAIVDNPAYKPPAPPPPRWSPPEKVDIRRLPVTGAELLGRQKKLALLDRAWESGETHVISLVAWGGVGKSTLVNKWLEHLAADNFRGARRVYGWSFYSQGTGERVTSADLFISEALTWFGDPDPTQGSPWDKGQRLADLVRRDKTLLILDGLEPLQSYLDYERGKLKDPALAVLLAELARQNQGLCVITTREAVADLASFPETTQQEDLEQISAEAGRALLRVGGVQGTDAELEQATSDFGLHALALNLLAAYVHEFPGHHISNASKIPDLDVPVAQGKHPRRVMAALAARFGGGPEVELLRMLGLFDRPADGGAIAALRAAPAIPNLTEHVQGLPEAGWLQLVNKLRRVRLIAPDSKHRPDTLDTHPLVREHFGQQLRQEYPQAWHEAHSRLYEYYKSHAKELPDTIEEMAPLFTAVVHGCHAGHHQEALNEVYWQRIQRGDEFFSKNKLGAFGADLAVLSGFFDLPWHKPVDGLKEDTKSFVLNEVGACLRALGRLAEAAQPIQASLEVCISLRDWKEAAIRANNLSELYLTIGDLKQALDYARQGVELADRSGDAFVRMARRTTFSDALHQAGFAMEAEATFREAEEMQKVDQPEFPLLYSVHGFRYCDLLLDQGQYHAVQSRTGQTLEWSKRQCILLDVALDHLSLGRALALSPNPFPEIGRGESERRGEGALTYLDRAVDGLRQAGTQDMLPRGLLARAEFHRMAGALDKARRDLDEAFSIATRGGMRLHEADCHLEYARWYLAMASAGRDVPSERLYDDARQHLAIAKKMIEEMGYHWRDQEVKELESLL